MYHVTGCASSESARGSFFFCHKNICGGLFSEAAAICLIMMDDAQADQPPNFPNSWVMDAITL